MNPECQQRDASGRDGRGPRENTIHASEELLNRLDEHDQHGVGGEDEQAARHHAAGRAVRSRAALPDRNMPEILSQSTRGEEIVPPGRILDAVNDPFQSCVIDDFSN